MNKLKTAIIFILSLIGISVIAYFIPFEKLFSNIPIFSDLYNNTSLTINSRNSKAVVKIDGKDYGETPLTLNNLKPGEYDIELERISNTPEFYEKKNIRITLERGTESVIDYELGPAGITSGYILYYTKTYNSLNGNGLLTVVVDQGSSSVQLDEEFYQTTPINSKELSSKSYQLKITKEGYEDLSFPIIIRNGYNLNIQASLYPIPTLLKK